LEYTDDLAAEDNAYVWGRFLAAVWDSLAKGAARDLVSYRAVATKLWRPFVTPIVDGTFGTRDFSRLMVHRRAIFQGEDALVSRVVPKATTVTNVPFSHDLPYYSKYILCAAYLASYNPARQDNVYFMKASEKKRRRRNTNTGGRVSKNRKIPRHLLTPSPFSLDRLLAILHAILPHDLVQTSDIYTQIATLSSIRLLVRTGVAGADVLDPGCKWRVNYGFEYISKLGRSVQFEIGEYLAGGGD
jgi:origin recognition complex subunit 5